jgi:hypothetical protein
VGGVLVRIPLYDPFVGLFVGCISHVTVSHVTRDTHVGLVALGWLDCLVFSMGFNLACSSTVTSPSPRRRLAVASPSPRRHLAPPFARHYHHHVHHCRPTRTATTTAIAIGIVCRYTYRCCCHHRRRSSRRRLCCLRRPCPDVSIAPDAPAAPPLPPSFVTDLTAVRLRLATVLCQRQRWRRRRRRRQRRSATDATAPTLDAAWTTPTSAWRTGSSSARSLRQWHRGAAAAESGDRDDIDACDRHRRVVHWAGGSGGR